MAYQPFHESASLFSSNRERRLWIWTAAVVLAIYSTLGLAAKLVGAIGDRRLIDNFTFICFLLVLATILTQGLKARPGGGEVGIALGVLTAYLFVIARMAIPAAERTHLVEYGVVALFIYEALSERETQGRPVPAPALLAIVATALVGALDECIQAVLPSRVFELTDILFNIGAAVMAVFASFALRTARQWTRRRAM